MDDIICGIYMIKNIKNSKCYIGQQVNIKKRWKLHVWELNNSKHSNEHLQCAWNKYGKDSFEFSVLEICSREQLNEKEIEYIDFYHANDPVYGYNITAGGDGLLDVPKETREKISKSISDTYKSNPEKRERNRQTTLKQFQDKDFYKKYREYRSSDEFREKERLSHLGMKMKEETKRKISKTLGKRVLCVETGEIFDSAKDAEKWLPGNINVKAAALGQRKTAGGYHWKYI